MVTVYECLFRSRNFEQQNLTELSDECIDLNSLYKSTSINYTSIFWLLAILH